MGVEPENTLRSYIRAERSGMDAIALDLQLSKDGALVALRDPEVDRTTDGSGAVAHLTLAELRELDAYEGERVPVFEDVLDAVRIPLQASVRDRAAAGVLTELLLRLDLTARVEVVSPTTRCWPRRRGGCRARGPCSTPTPSATGPGTWWRGR